MAGLIDQAMPEIDADRHSCQPCGHHGDEAALRRMTLDNADAVVTDIAIDVAYGAQVIANGEAAAHGRLNI